MSRSPHFCNSKRYPALLKFIVENTLSGKSDQLKERSLGVEVFDRPPDYDTNADTVVRYTAGEVRKRLSLYYHELGHSSRIQISLPAGSYVPEFVQASTDSGETQLASSLVNVSSEDLLGRAIDPSPIERPSQLNTRLGVQEGSHPDVVVNRTKQPKVTHYLRWVGLVSGLVALVIACVLWKGRVGHSDSALNDFWAPVIRDQHVVPICTGSSVFSQTSFSGVLTAGKDIEYPFVSMQIASSIARLSGLLQQNGVMAQLQPCASTPLTDLREHPIVLLGGYNNPWTLRLLEPLNFHFSREPIESIVDETKPGVRWERDHSLPYASAEDFGLVARYRDSKTDGWVVVAAGLGRNGTEGAAQVLTSAHYLQLLREQLGSDFGNRNVEAVLKVSVIDGKTAAPVIVSLRSW